MFLGPNGEVEEYSVTSIQRNAAISSDLILDQNEEHLFIMTPNMVCVSCPVSSEVVLKVVFERCSLGETLSPPVSSEVSMEL